MGPVTFDRSKSGIDLCSSTRDISSICAAIVGREWV